MTGNQRAGPLCRVSQLAERLGDVFVLVVEAGGNFTQPARFRQAPPSGGAAFLGLSPLRSRKSDA